MRMRSVLFWSCFCLCLMSSNMALAIWGQRGDIMVTEAPIHSSSLEVMYMQTDLRAMNEMLLTMQVPQYQFKYQTIGQQLLDKKFIFHMEIAPFDYEYVDWPGYTWHRYRFTELGKSLLDPGWAADIFEWIGARQERYRLPFNEVGEVYRSFCNGDVKFGAVPLIMIGTEYGQTVEDYTDFADFWNSFMNKHHYCITAVNWAVYKAVYDKSLFMRGVYEASFRDPQVVQAFDTILGDRLMGFFRGIGLIEEY